MVTTVAEIRDIVTRNLVRVEGSPQTFDWGKQGSDSLVARLGPNALGPNFKLNEHRKYAEVRCCGHSSTSCSILTVWH